MEVLLYTKSASEHCGAILSCMDGVCISEEISSGPLLSTVAMWGTLERWGTASILAPDGIYLTKR